MDKTKNKPILLPLLAPDLRATYTQLITELDWQITKYCQDLLQKLHCRPGCASCCISFTVLPVEAAIIRGALTRLNKPESWQESTCIFLDSGLCQIYPVRPVICRTQGLALGYIDKEQETINVSACPLNFPDDFLFSSENVFFLDTFNFRLAELNAKYVQDSPELAHTRIPLSAIRDIDLG